MKYTELKGSLEKGVAGIYLLEGEDAYFRTNAEEQIKSLCLQMPELDFSTFDGSQIRSEAACSELVAAICAYPFGSLRRVVKVTEFYPAADMYAKRLKETFENMPDTSVLIVSNSQKKAGEISKCPRTAVVDCGRSTLDLVSRWVRVTLRKSGVACSQAAAETVANYCLLDMSRVAIETEKLAESGRSEINVSDVDEIVYKDTDYRIYEMTEAIPVRDYQRFCEIMYELLAHGMDKASILTSLLNYFRTLLLVLKSPESDASLASELKMREYGVKKDRERARTMGEERLTRYVTDIYDRLCSMRSGNISQDGALCCTLNEMFFS